MSACLGLVAFPLGLMDFIYLFSSGHVITFWTCLFLDEVMKATAEKNLWASVQKF